MNDPKANLLHFLNIYMPIGVLVVFVIMAVLYILYFLKFKNQKDSKFILEVKNLALPIAFFVTLLATIMSLIYSDFLGQAPCGLCWLQRIFIYSQVVLYAVAYLKDDLKIFQYTFWLSVVGGIIALYHEWLQLGYSELIPCPTTPGLVDCAKPTFVSFGFVTMPFASLTVFLIIIFLTIAINKKNNS